MIRSDPHFMFYTIDAAVVPSNMLIHSPVPHAIVALSQQELADQQRATTAAACGLPVCRHAGICCGQCSMHRSGVAGWNRTGAAVISSGAATAALLTALMCRQHCNTAGGLHGKTGCCEAAGRSLLFYAPRQSLAPTSCNVRQCTNALACTWVTCGWLMGGLSCVGSCAGVGWPPCGSGSKNPLLPLGLPMTSPLAGHHDRPLGPRLHGGCLAAHTVQLASK